MDASIVTNDALLARFGSTFAVELQIVTHAFQSQEQKTGASSDFYNTVSVALSTDTPGVSVALAPRPLNPYPS